MLVISGGGHPILTVLSTKMPTEIASLNMNPGTVVDVGAGVVIGECECTIDLTFHVY